MNAKPQAWFSSPSSCFNCCLGTLIHIDWPNTFYFYFLSIVVFSEADLQLFKRDYYKYGKHNTDVQVPHLAKLAHVYHCKYLQTKEWPDCLKVSHLRKPQTIMLLSRHVLRYFCVRVNCPSNKQSQLFHGKLVSHHRSLLPKITHYAQHYAK